MARRTTPAVSEKAPPVEYPRPPKFVPNVPMTDSRPISSLSDADIRSELNRRDTARDDAKRKRRQELLLALRPAVPHLLAVVPHSCESGQRARTQEFDEAQYHEHAYSDHVPDCSRCVLLVMHGPPGERCDLAYDGNLWLHNLPREGDFDFSINFH